ncbi:SANT and BTB domain regulator of class switch recombination [Musca vetustissima]|uniref:SANT and BTB domain regulator of class switch recombination n=1 Tax=Musca vetustissima TaxID=27455 RepID=UPI002AB66048|nr:SANT and BTB domain regulator of class switch recombination [Musca vetustissima]
MCDTKSGSPEKEINLNEFLDFLNLSCHVNDMISQTTTQIGKDSSNHLHHQHHHGVGKTPNTGAISKSHNSQKSIDFQQLANNRLVNDLFGYRNSPRQTTNITDEVTDSGPSTGSSGGSGGGGGFTTEINRLRRQNSITMAKAKSSHPGSDGTLHPKLNEKLDFILNEGILDAVLPFICPVPLPANYNNRLKPKGKETTGKASFTTITEAKNTTEGETEASTSTTGKESNTNTTKSSVKAPTTLSVAKTMTTIHTGPSNKKEPEVIIHVCDEVKNTSKDFQCPQSLLVSKMGYFADVTAGQKLEDMDISVHCDIQIFDWLMKWVKSDSISSAADLSDGPPNLNVNNVVPILVSASFLQMEPLLLDCLSFCHSRLGEVVKASTNLSCLNDSIITRLADMFTNVELEMVRDKKDRLLPRLWTKLIQSLCEPEPEALRGHYYSLAGLFRCSKCNRCLTNTMKTYVPCIQGNVRLNRWGQLISHHVRDTMWDLNLYIAQLFKELKSWRRVYWKLWGHAHYLYCCLCEMYFPVYQMSWCRYHPEAPTFLGPVTDGRTTGPAGRYPCCGQQAFRFETLPGPNGCQFREHSVLVETDRERSILSIVQLATEGHALGDCPPPKMLETMASGETESRWMLLSLMPQRCRQGLLPVINPDESHGRIARRVRPASSKFFADSSTETESTDNTLENLRANSRKFGLGDYGSSFSTSSSDGCESSDSKITAPKKTYNKKNNRKSKQPLNPGRYWSGELSARSNQDNQREFEEKVMKQVIALVRKKNGTDVNVNKPNRPLGGIYVKLEQEWKDQLKQRFYNNNNNNSTGNTANNAQGNGNNCGGSMTSLSVKASRKKADNANGGGGGQ